MIFAKPVSKYNNSLLLTQQGLLHGTEINCESCMLLIHWLRHTKQKIPRHIILKIYRSVEYTSTKEYKQKSTAVGDRYPQVQLIW